MPFAAIWRQLEILILSEVCQEEKDKYHYMLYVESKMWHKWTYLQNKNTHRNGKQTCDCQGGGGGNGMDWSLGLAEENSYI